VRMRRRTRRLEAPEVLVLFPTGIGTNRHGVNVECAGSFHAWIVLYLLLLPTVLCSVLGDSWLLSYCSAALHIDFLTKTRIFLLPTHSPCLDHSPRRGRNLPLWPKAAFYFCSSPDPAD